MLTLNNCYPYLHQNRVEMDIRCHFGGSSGSTATDTAAKAPTNADAAASYSVQQTALQEQRRRGFTSTILTQGMGTASSNKSASKTLLGG